MSVALVNAKFGAIGSCVRSTQPGRVIPVIGVVHDQLLGYYANTAQN